MIKSDATDLLFAALVAVQAEVGTIPKTSTNPFFKSKYADLATAKEIADPIATKHGVAVVQFPAPGDQLLSVAVHTSGQYMGEYMDLHPIKSDPQSGGSAMTYGRRYAYFAVLGLVADEDDDGAAASRAATSARPASSSDDDSTRPFVEGDPLEGPPPGPLVVRVAKLSKENRSWLSGWCTDNNMADHAARQSAAERVLYMEQVARLETT